MNYPAELAFAIVAFTFALVVFLMWRSNGSSTIHTALSAVLATVVAVGGGQMASVIMLTGSLTA
jgi:hypothetical protein